MWAHALWHTGPFCLRDFPSKNTGVGCISFCRGSSRPRDWSRVSAPPALQVNFFFFFFLPLSHQGSMSQESLNTTNHPSATLERLHQLPSCSPLGISSQSVSLITGPVGQTFDCFWAFLLGFPSGSDSKESASNAGDLGLIPGSGRSPGEGNGYTLQYSCLEKFHGQTAWRATVHRVPRHWIKNINASP